ncbi:MAG: hypothetical protein ACJ8MR_12100 [Povalibacter sp.]
MSDYNMDVVPGTRAPVLGDALLERIHELNRDYVELLLAERTLPPPGVPTETLSSKIIDALLTLDHHARTSLARCPFALFTFGFDDERFWSAVLSDADTGAKGESVEARYGALSCAPMQAAFTEVALFQAWHTANAHRIAARVLFGMPEEIARRLVRIPLWQLRRVAIDYPGLLTPRWPGNPAFWPDLIRFAAARDSKKLETTQLLGNQLTAAELDGSLPRATRLHRLRMRRQSS